MRGRAHAKVNLFLRVLGRRADGYHEIETVLHEVSLADELEVRSAPAGRVALHVRASAEAAAQLPPSEDNLVARAARALAERCPGRGARIDLTKRIPVGAGLGGGSSDAAAALVALDELWGARLSRDALADLAARLGSDVPFFLVGGTARASGRGERIAALRAGAPLWLVLGISHRPLFTAAVYARWEGRPSSPGPAPLEAALAAGDPGELAAHLRNDLEPAALALRPELAAGKEAMMAAGALAALVSGSGPTVFGLARHEADAGAVAARVRDAFDRVEVVASAPGRGVAPAVLRP